ncbi:MAG: type II toxin-antitoxin system VapC family toxin [Leucobacter sp.]
MSKLLVDTNVLSEARRTRPNPGFASWWASAPETDLYISALTLGEIMRGIRRLEARDPVRSREYEEWYLALKQSFAWRIVEVDEEVAECWGEITAGDPRPDIDALLAATAIVNGMTLVTRNEKHLAGLPVRVLNPFD